MARVDDPFEWYETPWAFSLANGCATVGDMIGREVDPVDPASFSPENDGTAIVIAHRQRGVTDLDGGMAPGFTRIGGEVHMAKVTKGGVQTWCIHDFGDKVGERINPHG